MRERIKVSRILILCLMLAAMLAGCGEKVGTSGQETATGESTVTISIHCDTAVAKKMHLEEKWQGIIPADGVILKETTVELQEGETVFDILGKVRDEYQIHMQYNGTGGMEYIEGINNLYEFDAGRWSGWNYSVNGQYHNYGCGQYALKKGDVITWDYTCDLGKDLGENWTESEAEGEA